MINEDIRFHAKTGVKVVYSFENEDGTPRNMTGADVKLYVNNGFTKALTLTGETNKMELLLLGSDVADLVGKLGKYVVLDNTQTPPAEVAQGSLLVTGWL